MELVHVLRQLWDRRLWVGLVVIVAAVGSAATAYRLPSLEKRALGVGAASTQVLVDSPRSSLTDVEQDTVQMSARALVYAQAMSSLQARALISRESGIPAREITAQGPFSSQSDRSNFQAQPSEPRANELLGEGNGKRLLFDAQQDLPIISIYAQAPTAVEAETLANSASAAMRDYAGTLDSRPTGQERKVILRDLGPAEGGTVSEGANTAVMVLAFLGILGAGCMVIVLGSGFRKEWKRLGEDRREAAPVRRVEPAPRRRRLPRFGRDSLATATTGDGNGNGHAPVTVPKGELPPGPEEPEVDTHADAWQNVESHTEPDAETADPAAS